MIRRLTHARFLPVLRAFAISIISSMLLAGLPVHADIVASDLRPVGYHPSNIAYFNTPYLANAAAHGGEWFEFPVAPEEGGDFGRSLDFNDLPSQFIEGYPQFLDSGQKLRGFLFGLNIDNSDIRPPGWPSRNELTKGRVLLTWQGNADVRLVGCSFTSGESNGGETGPIANGRRVYQCNSGLTSFEVHEIQTPITDLKVWLPAVDDPATVDVNERLTESLENELFHPRFLDRIGDADWEFIRFMDLGHTNASPQISWSERRRPAHIFQTGIIEDRTPAPGVTFTVGDEEFEIEGNRETGLAFEHMIALCNATDRNLWINIPHLADADFITKLAQLIRFGSNGGNPHTTDTPGAIFPPLEPGLKVYVEYSNEIWSSGFAFPQGNWAQQQAVDEGLATDLNDFAGRAEFNARKFADVWRAFQTVFGGTTRLVRVAATFTANNTYTDAFLAELESYGAAGSPTEPDVLAITTYFGNGIQDFVHEQDFVTGKLFDDPYWTGAQFDEDLTTAFDEWKRRMLGGDASTGSGPDATGIGGGFNGGELRTMMNSRLGEEIPIVAYEGGPSLFTNEIDVSGGTEDDAVTIFIEQMNRDPRIADVYRIHLELAKSKGLRTHTPYVDTTAWSRFGQWGHLENLDQDPATAAKYALMLEHFATHSTLNHIEDDVAGAPSFVTPATLDPGIVGQAFTQDITTTGGAAPRTITVIGSFLEPGLTISFPSAGTLRVSGTPTVSRKNFFLARVVDNDGDPAWRIYTLEVFGGVGTLVQSNFRSSDSDANDDPGLNLPWTPTFVLAPNVTWSGWDIGAAQAGDIGVTPLAGDGALVFSVNAPDEVVDPDNESLADSVADSQFLTATVTPAGAIDLRGAEVRFTTQRLQFHAPLGYALFTSISGFAVGNALYVSPESSKDDFGETQHVVNLPLTAAYSAVSAPLELRIVAFGARHTGHATSISAFKLTQAIDESSAPATPTGLVATASSSTLVALSWNASANATSYTIERRLDNVTTAIAGIPGTSTTNAVATNKVVRYCVRAVNAGGSSACSAGTLATTFTFTDDPLVVKSTRIKRAHLIELRTAVNAARATAGLTAFNFTDPTITVNATRPKPAHVLELRTALDAALTALTIPLPSYATGVASGQSMKAVHLQELRTALK